MTIRPNRIASAILTILAVFCSLFPLPVRAQNKTTPVRVGYTIFENYQEGRD